MESLEERVAAIAERHRELEAQLSDPDVYTDQQRVQRLSQERARISEVVETYTDKVLAFQPPGP